MKKLIILGKKIPFSRILLSVCLIISLTKISHAQSWVTLGSGTNNIVYAMTVYNNQLVAAGNFTTAGGNTANYIAVWNGTSWSALGTGFNNTVYALTVYNGNLVAGGSFTTAGGVTAHRIAAWNGTAWAPLGSGIDNGQVNALVVYSGNLVAGGTFTTINSITMNMIAKWNGTAWSILTNGLNNQVNSLALYNGDLIVGGRFSTAGVTNTNRIARWNGTAWFALASGIDNGFVYALCVYNNTLIAGGTFSSINGVTYNNIASWNGTAWSRLSSGVNNGLRALTLYSGDLYAGGQFSTAGGNSASMIAKWNGSAWSALGSGITGTAVYSLSAYGGLLTAGGNFTTAGGQSANNIARWGAAPSAPTLVSPANNSTNQSLTPTLDWSDVTNAFTYRVQVSTNSSFSSTVIDTSGLSASQFIVPSGKLYAGITYYWRANASNGAGTSAYSSVWQFTTLALGSPTLISPLNGSVNQTFTPLLDWSDVSGALNYRIQISTDSLFGTTTFDTTGVTVSQLTVPSGKLLSHTVYYWRVNASNGSSSGSWSAVWHFRTILSIPTLLLPANGALGVSQTPLLDWTDITGASNYRVQVSTSSAFTTNVIDQSGLTASQYQVSAYLSQSTVYYWRVRAYTGSDSSSWTGAFSFTTQAVGVPSLISPVNGATGQSLTPLLDWSDVTSATSYRIQVSTDSLFSSPVFDTSGVAVSQLTIPSGKLTNGTVFYWRVNASNSGGTGAWSSIRHFKTFLLNPVLLTPSNGTLGASLTPLLDWTDVTGAANYRVQVSLSASFSTTVINQSGLTASQYQVTSGLLTYNTTYYWRAVAYTGTDSSAWTGAFSFTTLALGVPSLVSPVNGAVGQSLTSLLDWNDVSGATSYGIQVSIDSLFSSRVIDTTGIGVSQLTIPSGKLINGTIYYWRVNAVSGGIPGSWSAAWHFKTILSVPTLLLPSNGALGVSLIPLLDWSNVTGASNYRVQVSTSSAFTTNVIDQSGLTASQYQVSAYLSQSTVYYWRVRAYTGSDSSSWTGAFSFTTQALGVPSLVSPVNGAIGQSLTSLLDWNDVSGATSYGIQVSIDSLFGSTVLDTTGITVSQLTIPSGRLINGTIYYWRVNAVTGGIPGSWSAVWHFRTTLAAPVLILPSNGALGVSQTPLLDWSDVTGASNYLVQVSASPIYTTMIVNQSGLTSSQYQIPPGLLALNTMYYWRVKAYTGTDSSIWTGSFAFTTEGRVTLNLTIIPGGFYDPYSGNLNMRDTIKLYLIDTTGGYHKADSSSAVIDSVTFSGQFQFNNAQTGSYYIYAYHRNHIPVSTAQMINLSRTSATNYNFTDAATEAFGSNMIQVSTSPIRWGLIPGDANQDEYVDGLDQAIWIDQNGENGFFSADFNGDTYVDALDQMLWLMYNGNSSYMPYTFTNLLKPGLVIKRNPVNNDHVVKIKFINPNNIKK